MKTIAFLLLASIPFVGMSQSSDYKIASFLTEGTKAPNTHYIGEAWLNSVLQADDDINYNITKATFRANSTLDWHKHPTPQVLIIVEGEGYYQERGKEPIILKKGDVIKKQNIGTLQPKRTQLHIWLFMVELNQPSGQKNSPRNIMIALLKSWTIINRSFWIYLFPGLSYSIIANSFIPDTIIFKVYKVFGGKIRAVEKKGE